VQNSPFLEGVDFFATAKKDGVVSAKHGKISSKKHLRSAPNATLVFSHKFALMRKSTPSKKGEFAPH